MMTREEGRGGVGWKRAEPLGEYNWAGWGAVGLGLMVVVEGWG